MELDRNLLKEFAKITNDSEVKSENKYLRGTIVKNSGGKYVQLDGSTTVTPISELVDVEEGDRVLVTIENHKATIVGNFTFPPSARKEEEAIKKAESAQNTANGVAETANAAEQKAQEASTKADTAVEQASIASASANEAKQQATEAINKANTAQESIEETKTLANKASTDATEAKTLASQSQAASANAQAEVTRLQGEVDAAKEDVDKALEDLEAQAGEITIIKETYSTKVETENTKAELETEISAKVGELQTTVAENYATKTENVELEGRLQTQITQNAEGFASQASKIEQLESDTEEAQKDVAEALSKANAAQTAANNAQTNAQAAQAAANTATANAQAAADKAQLAQNAADAATQAANAADQNVQAAQEDLNEAKQNLASVTSRVDATEAEIAEAQEKVDAAQTAVNGALEDAAEARAIADNATTAATKAQQDAETAQGVATTAQQKADNAKTAADNAQAAANKAQADVAALTSRVTTAETSIKQNSDQVAINANKIIETGNKIDNLQIGGRNLFLNSSFTENMDKWVGDLPEFIEFDGKKCAHIQHTELQKTKKVSFNILGLVEPFTEYTMSGWVRTENITQGTTNCRIMFYHDGYYKHTDGTNKFYSFGSKEIDKNAGTGTWEHIVWTFKTNSKERIDTTTSSFLQMYTRDFTGDVYFYNLKLEKGNKATDWTPAPEDVDENITDAVDSIQIGSRNLLLNTSEPITADATDGNNYRYGTYYLSTYLEENQNYMISADVEILAGSPIKIAVFFYNNGTNVGCGSVALSIVNGRIEGSIVPNENYAQAGKVLLYAGNAGNTAGNKVKFSNVKLEKGNKATDWTPAPEDLPNNYYSKVQTDAKIKVESDRITSTVARVETVETGLDTLGSVAVTEGQEIEVDASENPAQLVIYGNTEQATRSGKNLLNIYDYSDNVIGYSKTSNGVTFTILDNGGISIVGTATASVSLPLMGVYQSGTTVLNLDGTYIISGIGSTSIYLYNNTTRTDLTDGVIITQTSTIDYVLLTLSNGTTYDEIIYPMLEEGETITEYEPYGVSPSPDYPSEIRNVGDNINLFNANGSNITYTPRSSAESYTINGANSVTVNSDGNITWGRINLTITNLLPNTKYSIRADVTNKLNCKAGFLVEDDNNSINDISTESNFESRITFITNSEGSIMIQMFSNWSSSFLESSVIFDNIEVKKDWIQTSYTPYNCGSVNIEFQNANLWWDNTTRTFSNTDNRQQTTTQIVGPGTYTFSCDVSNLVLGTNSVLNLAGNNNYDNGNSTQSFYWLRNIKTNGRHSYKLTINNVTIIKLVFKISAAELEKGGSFTISNLCLRRDDSDEYVEHQNQIFSFPFVEGQYLHKGDYISDNGIHVDKITINFDGTESDWVIATDVVKTGITRVAYANVKNSFGVKMRSNTLKCSHFYYAGTSPDDTYVSDISSANFYFGIKNETLGVTDDTSNADKLTAWKNWVANEKMNSTPLTVTCELAEETTTPFTPEQRKVWDSIKTFKGINYTYCIDEILPTNMIMTYYPNTPYNENLINKDDLNNAQTDLTDRFQGQLDDANKRIDAAAAAIQLLENMIVNLVVDGNGATLMQQTEKGWSFNMSTITGNLETIQSKIKDMTDEDAETSKLIDELQNLLNDVTNKTAYITIGKDDSGNPCIELGKTTNEFKVRITNTAIDFLEGSTKLAYANNNTFYVEKMIVKNELQIGEGPGFVWRTRANGNMGLVYISG